MKKVVSNLTVQVLVAISIGILVGTFFPGFSSIAKLISQAFINMITMLIAPIIFLTIVLGIGHMGDMKKVGRVGGKALLYFEVVSTVAIIIGMVVANVVKPGCRWRCYKTSNLRQAGRGDQLARILFSHHTK
jgi:aerobic C4-dicarboxylate transport protein